MEGRSGRIKWKGSLVNIIKGDIPQRIIERSNKGGREK